MKGMAGAVEAPKRQARMKRTCSVPGVVPGMEDE